MVAVTVGLGLAGCGADTAQPDATPPFTLPVGPTQWDATAPSWLYEGTLHVGERSVEVGRRVDQFVLGATGVYWTRGGLLMFTSAEGSTEEVAAVGWSNLAVSADRSVLATVDQSRGPTDRYGTHVMQVAAFDTRTGEQLYRTPDRAPEPGDDLADLYGEIMPLLHGVSNERLFYDGTTINLHDDSTIPATRDADFMDVYSGQAETLFLDGYRASIRGEGKHRSLTESSMYAAGRLSPDRSIIFDTGTWPSDAVVYDAGTGKQLPIKTPWPHFTLTGWSNEHTFFGVSERIDADRPDDGVRARQVVSCQVPTLTCTPLSPVIPSDPPSVGADPWPSLLMEGPNGTL